ncbi:MAG TPA: dicarboxylate/amino acid:cation symporter [Myxococcaceae bacterium]|nr:dicarboxylate/amino acid:cation symporter [Myxococcaceae bacterium]
MASQTRILVGIGVGGTLGLLANVLQPRLSPEQQGYVEGLISNVADPLGQLFLRLLFMLVVPLLFAAVVMGVCELDLKNLGKMGARMMGYTVVVSTIAVLIGLVTVNVLGPGRGLPQALIDEAVKAKGIPAPAAAPEDASVVGVLVSMVPDNPLKAAANGDMIGLIFFSLIFGMALSVSGTPAAKHLQQSIQGLYDALMVLIHWVLAFAPIGVGALIFSLLARLGLDVLIPVGRYVGVVVLGLSLHMFGVYSLLLKFVSGASPIWFFRGVREAMVTAFSTSSSAATLPTAIKVAEEDLKLPRNVSRFVLTAGSAMNQNGTALFEGVTVLFLAQVFQVDLTIMQQALVMGVCILAGIGTAGIPAGSLPVIAMILVMVGVPPEGLGLVLGVDRLLDMCRTTVNVVGDIAAAVFVAGGKQQGDDDDQGGGELDDAEQQLRLEGESSRDPGQLFA